VLKRTNAIAMIYPRSIYIAVCNKAYIESYDVTCHVYPSSTELHKKSKQMKFVRGLEIEGVKLVHV